MSKLTVFLAPCAALSILVATAAGCGGGSSDDTGEDGGGTSTPTANVVAAASIQAKSGSSMKGFAYITEKEGMVTLKVDVSGLPPGEHAIHIHEHGDCSSDDGESAGGHWNPTMEDHGKWGTPPFHLGDIGNITVDANGTGSLSITTDLWTVGTGETTDLVGHALLVHADPDDFVSQPSGNAGARLGCGAIERK